MDNKNQEFSLEDIIREFGGGSGNSAEVPQEEAAPQALAEKESPGEEETANASPAEETMPDAEEGMPDAEETAKKIPAEEAEPDPEQLPAAETEAEPECAAAEPEKPSSGVTGDTIRLDGLMTDLPKAIVRNAVPIQEEEEKPEPFTESWEPEYEQPMGEYVPPQPIVFQPQSRLRELKRKLVAGPEKRYYLLSEKGTGRLQTAIFFSLLIAVISSVATVMYAADMVRPERMKLMVFGQFFAMLLSALLGCNQMIDGVIDLFHKRFTLNTLLVFTFAACCADGVFCLQQLRVPCCAAFCLQVTAALFSAYQQRNAEIQQMDTMRRATRLDRVAACSDYMNGIKGFLRTEGQVEDFMDTYNVVPQPEKILRWYAFGAFLASVVLGIVGGVLYGVSAGVQVTAVSLLASVPATIFITLSRPFAVLERRLHSHGTVLCGWQGVQGLSGKAVFPVTHQDLYPAGSARMNGVKFYGNRQPDEIIAYCTAVVCADEGGLAPVFTQVLDSRNGRHYDASELKAYDGGLSAQVEEAMVLVGTPAFLRTMNVEVPEDVKVNHAICVAIDGQLCGLFALTYDKVRSASAGIATLCAYGRLAPVLVSSDFVLTSQFIRSRFGNKMRRFLLPEQEVRTQLRQRVPDADAPALLLTTRNSLAAVAYGVTGARALRTASILGTVMHMAGGMIGLGIILTLVILGALELLTPVNMFLYQLAWMIPGFLITEWTRNI